MRSAWIGLLVLGIVVALGQSAFSADIWQEQRLTETSWWETSPHLWGDKIYYTDGRSGAGDIYVWDAVSGSSPVIEAPGSQGVVAVYEDNVLYASYTSEIWSLHVWDPVNGSRDVRTDIGRHPYADIWGDTVVWEDYRDGTGKVYKWDPVNGESRITSFDSSQGSPRIWGDNIIWLDGRHGGSDVYMWNPTDGERLLTTFMYNGHWADIHEDRVVMWVLYDPDIPWSEPGLWEWTPEGGLKLLWLKAWGWYHVMYTRVWGDLVVWQCGNGPANIGAWDPVHGFTGVNQCAYGDARMPSLYDGQVAWVGDYDIYLSTLVPEPSGFVALFGFLGMLWTAGRRRRNAVES